MKYKIRADDKGNLKTVNLTPIKSIRFHCLECFGFSYSEVRDCDSILCPLFPYRLGKRPKQSGEVVQNED